ncbi:MAG: HAMP domain-containing histidine kinase [Fusobacteria bacterium]|nr:HAMP domain-containing histidine kinase [Fusobacteriota bacterium]
MFGRISHEIKNPLSVILANIQMLKIDIGEIKNIEKKELKNLLEMANAIEEASRLGRNIVGNVVNYSRKESDADYKVNLNEVIDSVNSFMRKDLEINGINLKIKLEENLNILAKRSEIIQVFLNLIINAKDSILENKNIKDKKIGIYAEKKGELITIIIKDNGVGIKKEVGNKIFEPFYTTKIINKGTGLGLSIVKEILNRYNAVIYVESVEEKETKFIINFINYKKN